MPATSIQGLVSVRSSRSVDETVEKLAELLKSKAITLFALIDHSGEAAKVGLSMPSTKLLIFGNPRVGTPLMLAVPMIAIDLPLKILVWEDREKQVWVTYCSPTNLRERYRLPTDLTDVLAVVETLAELATRQI
jgi:uncharacterized protein (DUF302 family)